MIGIPTKFALSALGAGAKRIARNQAIIQGAGNVASTLGIAGLNTYLQDRAFKKNKEWWKQQFDYSANYDTPKAQIERMKEAGLNPALMYGGQGSIQGAPSPSSGSMEAGNQDLQSLSLMSAQAMDIKKDMAVKMSQIANINADTLDKMNKTRLTGANADVAEQLKMTNINLIKRSLQLKDEELLQAQIQTRIANKTQQYEVMAIINKAKQEFAQLGVMNAQKKVLISQKLLNEAKANMEQAGIKGGLVGYFTNFLSEWLDGEHSYIGGKFIY